VNALPNTLVRGSKSAGVFKDLLNLIWVAVLIGFTCIDFFHFRHNISAQFILDYSLEVFFSERSVILVYESYKNRLEVVNDCIEVPMDKVCLIRMNSVKFGGGFLVKHFENHRVLLLQDAFRRRLWEFMLRRGVICLL
jgi:hypothetical protein